jgi:hypothetical protein
MKKVQIPLTIGKITFLFTDNLVEELWLAAALDK